MKIPEFEGLFDMHSEYLLPGIFIVVNTVTKPMILAPRLQDTWSTPSSRTPRLCSAALSVVCSSKFTPRYKPQKGANVTMMTYDHLSRFYRDSPEYWRPVLHGKITRSPGTLNCSEFRTLSRFCPALNVMSSSSLFVWCHTINYKPNAQCMIHDITNRTTR